MNPDIVRIFAGCDPNDCDLEQMMVLEHSMKKRSSLPVEITWLRLSKNPASPWYSNPLADATTGHGWRTERWATPFSGLRWAIPSVCEFQGRAIYMDTDMVVLSDIAELWRTPIRDSAVFAARQDQGFQRYCVMLWDCAAARAALPSPDQLRDDPEGHKKLTAYFKRHAGQVQALDPAFNSIDGDGQPIERIKVLHYSDMGSQFSHPYAFARLKAEGRTHWFDGRVMPHPRADLKELFDREYREALEAGRRLDQYRNPEPFGPLIKKSERKHAGNPVTRGQSRWSRLKGLIS